VEHTDGARNIRNKRVRIRIKASNPTKKKDPTSAMYSALSIELAIRLWLVSSWQALGQHSSTKHRACLHVQTANERNRGHALLQSVQIHKNGDDMYRERVVKVVKVVEQ
jgi:hypothetical protein